MREWLSGRASPCQGEGREFESPFALDKKHCVKPEESGFLLAIKPTCDGKLYVGRQSLQIYVVNWGAGFRTPDFFDVAEVENLM